MSTMALPLRQGGAQEQCLAFLDDVNADHSEDRELQCTIPRPMNEPKTSDASFGWTQRQSVQLQQVVDTMNVSEITNLNFSVTVADITKPDCPIVAMSEGFAELTGYSLQDIVGQNCRFLLDGVPPHLINQETRIKCRAFCQTADGIDCQFDDALPDDLKKSVGGYKLPKGELVCTQINARKSGELFRNMFYMKFVELDDRPYIFCLQVGMPGAVEPQDQATAINEAYQTALVTLALNMTTIEQVLANQFWYAAPMRRQV